MSTATEKIRVYSMPSGHTNTYIQYMLFTSIVAVIIIFVFDRYMPDAVVDLPRGKFSLSPNQLASYSESPYITTLVILRTTKPVEVNLVKQAKPLPYYG